MYFSFLITENNMEQTLIAQIIGISDKYQNHICFCIIASSSTRNGIYIVIYWSLFGIHKGQDIFVFTRKVAQ